MHVFRLLRIDWDVVAGAIAAVVAMLFHVLGIASEELVRGVLLLLLALLLLRDLRQEGRTHQLTAAVESLARKVASLEDAVGRHDVIVIGPKRLRQEFGRFAHDIRGEVTWYHVCGRMFRRQELFDATLGQLLANEAITSVQLLLDDHDRATWAADLEPKLARHPAAAKVHPPLWGSLSGGVSFVLAENGEGGSPEALIGILEEPFAARTATASLPRYVLRIHNESELLGHVVELARHATSGFEPGHESGLRVAAEPTPAAG